MFQVRHVHTNMGAKSKRAAKVRQGAEFDVSRLTKRLQSPNAPSASVYSWNLEHIFLARNAQIRGDFALPAALAVAMRTDAAIGVARRGRLAPQKCIQIELVAAEVGGSESVRRECESLYGQKGVAVPPGVRADINGCLVDHGVAFAFNVTTVRDDGSRTDLSVHYWPIEHVRWDALKRCYVTRVEGEPDEEIHHGDGRWIVFSANDCEPHKQDAALLDAALVWASRAFAKRDWSKSSVAHGSAKVIGELPEGVALQNAEGVPTPEAASFAELLRAIASSDAPVGIRPAGSKTDFLTNTSTAWQVFDRLVEGDERMAARIFLGTDGILGSNGGAPGVDIAQLFGVATTKVAGDLATISRGLQTGSIEIWAALNFGDSVKAPTHRYMIPDVDAEADRAAKGARRMAFFADIKEAKASGFEITQEYVDAVAEQYDIDPPTLALAIKEPDESAAKKAAGPVNAPAAPAAAPPLRAAS